MAGSGRAGFSSVFSGRLQLRRGLVRMRCGPFGSAVILGLLIAAAIAGTAAAQGRGGAARAGGPPPAARAQAPKDFTGYWVAVVTEHWHLRMEMPPKNDFSMLPVNAEARRLAGMWTPAQDTGNECRAYGAASIMRVPGRLHIFWVDDNTLE